MKQVLDDFPGDTLRGNNPPAEPNMAQPYGSSRPLITACRKFRSDCRALVELPSRPSHPNVAGFGSATRITDMHFAVVLLVFAASTICWSVAFSGSPRPSLLAIAGNAAAMSLLFLSMQPSRVAKAEILFSAAEIPLMALLVLDAARL
jgi:hypothetical protein